MTVIEQTTITREVISVDRGIFHYAGVDNPRLSLCGILVAGPRIIDFKQNEVCGECVEKMLDWISWCHRNGREPTGEPWVFREGDDS